MKQLTALSGFCLSLIVLLLFACQKNDAPPLPQHLAWQVVRTTPGDATSDIGLADTVSAIMNVCIDTSRYTVSLSLSSGKVRLTGAVTCCNSVVRFACGTELTPYQLYTANLVVKPKLGGKEFRYAWSFSTKGPDQYRMTLRSEQVTDGNRDGTRCMQIGNYFYSFGGWKDPPFDSYNDVYRSTGNLAEWERQPEAPWHGRHVFGIARIEDSTYVVGGDPFHTDFDVWRTTDGQNWTKLSSNLLGNRVLYGCTAHNGYIYVVGGKGYSDVWRSANGADWELVTDNLPFLNNENFAGSLISFRGRLWMVCGGGDGWGGGTPRKEVWSSADGRQWRRENDFAGSARYYTDLCVWDNKLWVVGGYNYTEGNVQSIWYMKPDGTWHQFDVPQNYVGRHATGVGVYNNQLAITCGNYQNNCWVIEKVK